MDRTEELRKLVENDSTYFPLIDHLIYLENELDRLVKLPKIKINPKNTEQQKATPAAKLYKEFFQQYINGLKALSKASGSDDEREESLLNKWVKSHVDKE